MPRMLWMALAVWTAAGQTQIDLSTQAKNSPIKSGASLPSTCTAGQLFFLSSAPTGSNLYGCTAANTWATEGGQAGAGGILGTLASMPASCTVGQTYFAIDATAGANLYGCSPANTWTPEGVAGTVQSNGLRVGSRATTNFLTGPGLITVITDTGSQINIQSNLDTAVAETLAGEQTGSSLLCSPTSSTANAYGCSMTPTATAYTAGMVLRWMPGINGAGGATTLNVDSLGAKGVKQADGVSDPSATDIAAGGMREVWYDGVNFRFLGGGTISGTGAVQSVFGRTGTVTAANGDYTASQVTNAATTNSSNTFAAGTQDFSRAAHTLPMIVAATAANLPATCTAGELGFVTGATAGQQIYECSSANTWTQQVAGGSSGSYVMSLGPTPPVSQTGSNIALYSVPNVPALGAGQCYTIDGGVIGSQAGTYEYLYVDSTLLYTFFTYGSGVGNQRDYAMLRYCNQAGTQAAQSISIIYQGYSTNDQSLTPYAETVDLTPTAVDQTISHTYSLVVKGNNGATATGTVFRIGQ